MLLPKWRAVSAFLSATCRSVSETLNPKRHETLSSTNTCSVLNRHNILSLSYTQTSAFPKLFSLNQSRKWRRERCSEYAREGPLSVARKSYSRKWQTISNPILTCLLLSPLPNPRFFILLRLQVITGRSFFFFSIKFLGLFYNIQCFCWWVFHNFP